MHSIDDILKVEGAGGQDIPLLGYVEADIAFPEQTSGVKDPIPTIILVVPNTSFNKDVPVVIGTNCIRHCMSKCHELYGKSFLQQGKQDLAWRVAYKCMTQQSRKYNRILKASQVRVEASKPLVIKPNETTILWSSVKSQKTGEVSLAMAEELSSGSSSPPLQVIPTVANVKMNGLKNIIPVKVHNASDADIALQPMNVWKYAPETMIPVLIVTCHE